MNKVFFIIVISILSSPAIAETKWRGITTTDEFSDETTVTVGRFGTHGHDEKFFVSFACRSGYPYFTLNFYHFIGFANQPFELMIRIDDNDAMRIPMKIYNNSTDSGYTTDERILTSLLAQMKAGKELKWRTDTASERLQGSIRLNGFTKQSIDFADACLFD